MEEQKSFEDRVDEVIIHSLSIAINIRKLLKELYFKAGGILDAPNDNKAYIRKNKTWFPAITRTSQLINDGTDGTNTYALESSYNISTTDYNAVFNSQINF